MRWNRCLGCRDVLLHAGFEQFFIASKFASFQYSLVRLRGVIAILQCGSKTVLLSEWKLVLFGRNSGLFILILVATVICLVEIILFKILQ